MKLSKGSLAYSIYGREFTVNCSLKTEGDLNKAILFILSNHSIRDQNIFKERIIVRSDYEDICEKCDILINEVITVIDDILKSIEKNVPVIDRVGLSRVPDDTYLEYWGLSKELYAHIIKNTFVSDLEGVNRFFSSGGVYMVSTDMYDELLKKVVPILKRRGIIPSTQKILSLNEFSEFKVSVDSLLEQEDM